MRTKLSETVAAVRENPETLDNKGFGIWRSGRDSNPRAVSAATRFPIVLVMTSSIPLQIGKEVTIHLAAVVRRNVDYYNSFFAVVKGVPHNFFDSFFVPPARSAAGEAPPETAAAAWAGSPPPAGR